MSTTADPAAAKIREMRERKLAAEADAAAEPEEVDLSELSFCEACSVRKARCKASCAQCWVDFKYLAHHTNPKTRRDFYFNNTCRNWKKICSAFLIIYAFWGFLFWGLMEAALAIGPPVLWAYFAIFWVFVAVIIALVVVGHVEYLKQEAAREREIAEEEARLTGKILSKEMPGHEDDKKYDSDMDI